MAGATAGAVDPGAAAPANTLGSRPGGAAHLDYGHVQFPRGSHQANGGGTDESLLVGEGVLPARQGHGVGVEGVFQAAGLVGDVGGDLGRVALQQDERGGWVGGTVRHQPGVPRAQGAAEVEVLLRGGGVGIGSGGSRSRGRGVGHVARGSGSRRQGARASQGVGSGGDGLVRGKEIEGARGARPEPDAEVGVVVVAEDLPGEGLHVGDGDVAEAYGIDPVRDGGGDGEGRVSWARVKFPSLVQYETCPARLTRANLKCPCPAKGWPETVIRPE